MLCLSELWCWKSNVRLTDRYTRGGETHKVAGVTVTEKKLLQSCLWDNWTARLLAVPVTALAQLSALHAARLSMIVPSASCVRDKRLINKSFMFSMKLGGRLWY